MLCPWTDSPGSAIGFLLLQHFSVGLAVEHSCCFISALNLDLYADRITCMFMNQNLGRGFLERKAGLSHHP